MSGVQPGQLVGLTVAAGASSQMQQNVSAAAQMNEGAEDSQHVLGVPSMVGVPVHGKDQDARRAFQYQYSVASAWWQRWYLWYEKAYPGGSPNMSCDTGTGKPGQGPMMPSVQMGLPAMVPHLPGTGSDDGGSMHTPPKPFSDGCTNDESMQPHSTVSSDAGKSSVLKAGEHKVCKNCGTDCTPFWRKDKNDQLPLCNACGLYAAKNGSMRPASLWRQEEGISPVPRNPPDDAVMDARAPGTFPASAPLPGLPSSDQDPAVPSEALSDPLHPSNSMEGATGVEKIAADEAKPSMSDVPSNSGAQPTVPGQASGSARATFPAGPIVQAFPSVKVEPTMSKGSQLPPLNKTSAEGDITEHTQGAGSQSATAPVAGHPVSDAHVMPPVPVGHPGSNAMPVPTAAPQVPTAPCYTSEDSMQLPSAAELLSGGLPPPGSMSTAMLPPGPTLMPSPMVAPYNARFVQLGTIGHGPQQYPIVQFAGGTMPHFRPQRTRSDAHSTLPPLPPLATSAPPASKQPSFVSGISEGASSRQQRSKRSQRLRKDRRTASQTQALSDSTPLVSSPHFSPWCGDMSDVAEEVFDDADAAAFDRAELEAILNDDIPIPLDLQEGGCESNAFCGPNSLGDLDCGVPFSNDGTAARAHSAPDPFEFD